MFEQFFSYLLEGWSTPSGILSQGQVGIRDCRNHLFLQNIRQELPTVGLCGDLRILSDPFRCLKTFFRRKYSSGYRTMFPILPVFSPVPPKWIDSFFRRVGESEWSIAHVFMKSAAAYAVLFLLRGSLAESALLVIVWMNNTYTDAKITHWIENADYCYWPAKIQLYTACKFVKAANE